MSQILVQYGDGMPPKAPSEPVRVRQRDLVRAGWVIKVDGVFGEATLRALNAFQRRHGLFESKAFDQYTLDALQGDSPTPPMTVDGK